MRRVKVGDRVTVPFVCGCGSCSLCSSGNAQVCEQQWQPGFHGQGCWAQYVRVPQVGQPVSMAVFIGCEFVLCGDCISNAVAVVCIAGSEYVRATMPTTRAFTIVTPLLARPISTACRSPLRSPSPPLRPSAAAFPPLTGPNQQQPCMQSQCTLTPPPACPHFTK